MAVRFQGYKIVRTCSQDLLYFQKLAVGTSTINKSKSTYPIKAEKNYLG